MAEAAWFNSAMDLDLFHMLVEDSYAATVPQYPDLLADEFGRYFVIGARHFDIAVAMDVALGFLKTGKQRVRQWLQVGAFFFKEAQNLFARRAVDTLIGDLSFPLLEKEVFFTQ